MDELVIGDQTYLSSKRAAKITGYAKDYIGQLCREGRVTAKLVGRSWYVLESSIRDHRFGDASGANVVPAPKVVSSVTVSAPEPLSRTWNAPRYEAVTNEVLPPINRLDRDVKAHITTSEHQDQTPSAVHQDMNAAWQAWFNRVEDIKASVPVQTQDTESLVDESSVPLDVVAREPISEPEHIPIEDPEVSVPIHAIYQPELRAPEPRIAPPIHQTLDSRSMPEDPGVEGIHENRTYGAQRAFIRLVYLLCFFVSISSVALAVMSSGYFDSYIISLGRAHQLTGIYIYNSR